MTKKSKNEDQQDMLKNFKKDVQNSHDYFRPNYERFWDSKNFSLRSSVNKKEAAYLDNLGKPNIEFNIEEAHVSRLVGEFAKQTPQQSVSAADDAEDSQDLKFQVELVDGILRHIANESNIDGSAERIYMDQMYGGFSVWEIYTKYSNPMSFHQVVGLKKTDDPTLCGFDPIAELPHKGDGRYCFKIYPKSKDDFKSEFPEIDISSITFTKSGNIGGFNWSYNNGKEDALLVCDYYYKKKERVKIVKLAMPLPTNGKSIMREKEYKEELSKIPPDIIFVPPMIVDERFTEIERIYRCRFIENKIIENIETDFDMFPLIFVDGNSSMLRKSLDGGIEQFTKPFLYHAKGTQRLKNFAGQTLAGQLEDIMRSKLMMAIESLPQDEAYREALTNNQIPSIILYQSINPKTGAANPPPQIVSNPPIPPEISNTFTFCDQTMQAILGSYGAATGNISPNDSSGRAVLEAAMQANSSAMPQIMGYLVAWSRVCEVIVSLIPKYYIEKDRKVPFVSKDNKKSSVMINQENGLKLDYEPNSIQVKVTPGVNFSVQKYKALQVLISIMNVSPSFGEFMASPFGMPFLLKNIEMEGADQVRDAFGQFIQWKDQQMQQQMQQQQQQQAEMMKNDPRMLIAQANMIKAQSSAAKDMHEIKHQEVKDRQTAADLAIQETKAQNERLDTLAGLIETKESAAVREMQQETERMSKAVDFTIAASRHAHEVHSDIRKHKREESVVSHNMLMDHLKYHQSEKNNATKERQVKKSNF